MNLAPLLTWTETIKMFTGLVAILNPLGASAVFMEFNASSSQKTRRQTMRITSMSVFTIMLVVMFLGEAILRFFGISIASFRVGGGILILNMAMSMLKARQTRVRQTEEEREEAISKKKSIAVVPLAIPMLAGPGSISTMILYSHRAQTIGDYCILVAVALAAASVVYGIFSIAPRMTQYLGKTGINIMTRIMGLVTASIAVEFIAGGLLTLLPGLR